MGLITSLTSQMQFAMTETVNGIATSSTPTFGGSRELANGTGLDQCNVVWTSLGRSLAATTADDIDLISTGFKNPLGVDNNFAKVRLLYIKLLSLVVGDKLEVGNHATAPWLFLGAGSGTWTHPIGPGGHLLMFEPSLAGIPVVATTGDILRIYNPGATTVTFDIAIAGSDA